MFLNINNLSQKRRNIKINKAKIKEIGDNPPKNKNITRLKNNLLLIIISGIIIYIIIEFFNLFVYRRTNNNINFYNIKITNASKAEKLNTLLLVTNNNKYLYQGMKNCLLNDPDKQLCIYHLLAPKKVVGKKRILLGEKRDGCYVLLDDFKDIKIAYSFGISNMIQFDRELAQRGIDVYMYDHTIKSLPYYNPRFHWKK